MNIALTRTLRSKAMRATHTLTRVAVATSRSPSHPINNAGGVSLSQKVDFHGTPAPAFSTKRRRPRTNRRGRDNNLNDGSSESPLKHDPIDDVMVFKEASTALLTKIENAVLPMVHVNDVFVVRRLRGELGEILTIDLSPKEGSYRLEVMESECLFQFTSPISGKVLYVLSAETGEWVGLEDGHLFEGLLVRDLIRQCRGLPKL